VTTELLNSWRGDNGTLFWVAVATCGTGLILLLLACLFQIGRWLRSLKQRWQARRSQGTGSPARQPGEHLTVGPYGSAPYLPPATSEINHANAVPQATTSPKLAALLQRLQAATDRLEEQASLVMDSPGPPFESALKPGGNEVEYVFKASRL
jgi:hypothetical protein